MARQDAFVLTIAARKNVLLLFSHCAFAKLRHDMGHLNLTWISEYFR